MMGFFTDIVKPAILMLALFFLLVSSPAILIVSIQPVFCAIIQIIWVFLIYPFFPTLCLGRPLAETCVSWQFLGTRDPSTTLIWCDY